MARHIDDIKNKLSYLHANINIVDLLMEFERTLDSLNIYAYENWMDGELVEGPNIERYWVTVKLMYPAKRMPNEKGAVRLIKYGCKVVYEKDKFKVPVSIKGKESYGNFAKKEAKVKIHDVWIVTIVMPKRFLDERILDSISSNGESNSLVVDTEDISQAYDDSIDSVEDMDAGGGMDAGGMDPGIDPNMGAQ